MNNAMKSFKDTLSTAKNVLILSGSGVSAESGVPTFRGSGGLWRTYQATYLATPQAFKANPSLVWEFYEYRRDVASKVHPNKVCIFFNLIIIVLMYDLQIDLLIYRHMKQLQILKKN